jgi:predicted nuclease of restriction endonuclease-like RecB superfamily
LGSARVPFRIRAGTARIDYLGAHDYSWLSLLLAEFLRFEKRRWRELEERLKEPFDVPLEPMRFQAAIQVLRRLFGSIDVGRVDAVRARKELFELAAHRASSRGEVLEEAAANLRVSREILEESLFGDVREERRVKAPSRPITPSELALRVNSRFAQTLVRGASEVEVEAYENVRSLVRHARLRGLLVTVASGNDLARARLSISGPFVLFRHTLVYGRALAELVPLLARSPRFSLSARCRVHGENVRFVLESGDPLFPADNLRAFDSRLEERFAREMARLAPDWQVLREPAAIPALGTLLFPDFLLCHRLDPRRRFFVEILGFWTEEYLSRKLESLRAARIENLILLIDEARRCSDRDFPPNALVVRYRKKVEASTLLPILERSPRQSPDGALPSA